jgi:hypothetical protein
MVFTLEQDKFVIMSYYRNGVKRDEQWTYTVQVCKEEFLANYPDQNVLEKSQLSYIELLIVLLLPIPIVLI